jgi:hypothetical protein
MERKFNGHLTFVSDPHFHMEEFTITNEQSGQTVYSSVEA